MIELVNTFIVGTNQTELETLQGLLAGFSPNFTFSIVENTAEPLTYKLIVEVADLAPVPDMGSFLEFLLIKIEQVNQQT